MESRDLDKCRRVVDDLLLASIDAELNGQFVLANDLRQQWRGAKRSLTRSRDTIQRPYGSALSLRLLYITQAKKADAIGSYVRASNLRQRAKGVALILAVLRSSEKARRQRMERRNARHKREYAARQRAIAARSRNENERRGLAWSGQVWRGQARQGN